MRSAHILKFISVNICILYYLIRSYILLHNPKLNPKQLFAYSCCLCNCSFFFLCFICLLSSFSLIDIPFYFSSLLLYQWNCIYYAWTSVKTQQVVIIMYCIHHYCCVSCFIRAKHSFTSVSDYIALSPVPSSICSLSPFFSTLLFF